MQRLVRFTSHRSHLLSVRAARHQSQHSTPSQWRPSTPGSPPNDDPAHFSPYDQNYAKPTALTLDVFRRIGKYFAVGLFTVGVTAWTAFEGAHMWVEKVEMAVEDSDVLRAWGWTQDAERWSGGASGGTDPALGIKARHAVRSAWIAQHWGTGSNIISANTLSGGGKSDSGGIHAVEAGLQFAHDFLNIALTSALGKGQSSGIHPQTVPELLTRHASVLERMGTKSTLFEARAEYERVWASSLGRGLDAARIAWKIGDLCSRLGDGEEAIDWWARAIILTDESREPTSKDSRLVFPDTLPHSPRAQRTLLSVLSSLSAHYAQNGYLKQAQVVEESGLNLLKTVGAAPMTSPTPPPQTLHQLFLLHRSSLLSIHLGEVLYALRKDPKTSLQLLQDAAASSEKVVLTLSGLPLTHPDAPLSSIPHPPTTNTPLLPVYCKSRTMRRPASSLLRDARRSAAEAWNLAGLLYEGTGKGGSPDKALECYERALGWAGVNADSQGGIGGAGEGVLEKEWQALWSNYVRTRDIVHKKGKT